MLNDTCESSREREGKLAGTTSVNLNVYLYLWLPLAVCYCVYFYLYPTAFMSL